MRHSDAVGRAWVAAERAEKHAQADQHEEARTWAASAGAWAAVAGQLEFIPDAQREQLPQREPGLLYADRP